MKLKSLLMFLLLFSIACNKEDEKIDKKTDYDSYSIFTIDGKEYAFYSNFEPEYPGTVFTTGSSYVYDSNDVVKSIGISTYLNDIDEAENTTSFEIAIFSDKDELNNLIGKSTNIKADGLVNYFEGKSYNKNNDCYDQIIISFSRNGLRYSNLNNNNLLYEFNFLETELFNHPIHGNVMKAKETFNAQLENNETKEIVEISGEMYSYFLTPFESNKEKTYDEYLKHDYYSKFLYDGIEYTLYNDQGSQSLNPNYYAGGAYTTNPDGSIEDIEISTNMDYTFHDGKVISVQLSIISNDNELINSKESPVDERSQKFISYYKNKKFTQNDEYDEKVFLSIIDENGNNFNNIKNSNLNYSLEFKEIEIHSFYNSDNNGSAIKATVEFDCDLPDVTGENIKHIIGEMCSYYMIPFEN